MYSKILDHFTDCYHPVNPGVNRDVKMRFTYKLITWSHKVATLLFWPPSVVVCLVV